MVKLGLEPTAQGPSFYTTTRLVERVAAFAGSLGSGGAKLAGARAPAGSCAQQGRASVSLHQEGYGFRFPMRSLGFWVLLEQNK